MTHVFVDDGTKDHRGNGRCAYPGCGLPAANRVHGPPPETPDGDVSDRILGEAETVDT